MIRYIRCAALALMLAPAVSVAQDFAAGDAAYSAGDYAKAIREWTPLAEQGDALAQTRIAIMYDIGTGVPQDYAEAMKWYRLAAAQGDAFAQTSIGSMYLNGTGVPQDYTEAMKWFRLAAAQGDALGQYAIGIMYYTGFGAAQDYIAAHMWLNISAANGDLDAGANRDEAAAKMTPADISEAQRRAKVCMASSYQDCD